MGKPIEIAPAAFLALLRESRLIEPAVLRAALVDAPTRDRAKSLARYLMKRDLLTRFQAQQLLVGRSGGFFLGQYRILDLIGSGGMGKVYKAEHMTMSRLVALKVLNSDVTRTERARQLFRREVRAAARLVHPNIATAFDANEVNGRAFLVLEYVGGPSLAHLIHAEGPLPIGQACELIRQAALGLQHAHELGMVHRDIKPSNLLIQPPVGQSTPVGGTLKVVDFGLALLPIADESAENLEPEHHIVLGTPDFLSPEQAEDLRSVDIRSDLYGLGCTFYFLLTGQVPFPGGTAVEKLDRHANDIAEPVEMIRPDVPPELAVIVRKLMAKEPGDRFQTPRELAAALTPFAEVHPVVWSGPRRVSSLSGDEFVIHEEGAETEGGSSPSSGGTVSLAELAANFNAAGHNLMFKPSRGRSIFWFLAALTVGFLLGVALIVATMLFRD